MSQLKYKRCYLPTNSPFNSGRWQIIVRDTTIRAIYASIIFAALLFLSSNVLSDTAIDRAVSFFSEPSGASVCKKYGKRQDCYGVTPIDVKFNFNDNIESKKIVINKFGFISEEMLVDSKTDNISIKLKPLDIFVSPDSHTNNNLKIIQKEVNRILEDVIYRDSEINGAKYQILGKSNLVETPSGIGLRLSVSVNDFSILKQLKKASRNRNQKNRYKNTIITLYDNKVLSLLGIIAEKVSFLGLTKINYEVIFSNSKNVLDFQQLESSITFNTSSYYTGAGDSRRRIDVYETYNITEDVTKVRDKSIIVNYVFIVKLEDVNRDVKLDLYSSLKDMEIYTNDNKKGEYSKLNVFDK